jgi:hypothetical protein
MDPRNVLDLAISSRTLNSPTAPKSYIGLRIAAKTGTSSNRIPLVNVIDRSNANHSSGIGRIDYLYMISKFLITNSQYVDFLNSIASTDTYSLYKYQYGRSDNWWHIKIRFFRFLYLCL